MTASGTKWSASSGVTVTDDRGKPVAGAQVTVTVTTTGRRGTSTTTSTVTTGADGTADINVGPYSRSGYRQVDSVQVEVSGIASGGLGWDGAGGSVTANRP